MTRFASACRREQRDGYKVFSSLQEQNGTVWRLAWSPDSQRLAVSRSNGAIALWSLPEIERVLAGLSLSP